MVRCRREKVGRFETDGMTVVGEGCQGGEFGADEVQSFGDLGVKGSFEGSSEVAAVKEVLQM